MLIHPTVTRLRDIGLSAMADALVDMANNPEAAELPHADWLGLLIDREATARDNRRLSRRLQAAKLRQAAVIENVDPARVPPDFTPPASAASPSSCRRRSATRCTS